MPDDRVRRYAITSFDDEPPYYNGDEVAFLIYEKETCPTTGNFHWQVYAEFYNKVSVRGALDKLGIKKGHAEAAKGSGKQNIEYCSKEKKAITFGQLGQMGNRTDIDDIFDDIMDGLSTKQILKKYRGRALRLVNMISRARSILNDTDEREQISNMKEREKQLLSSVPSFPEGTFHPFVPQLEAQAEPDYVNVPNAEEITREMDSSSDHRSYKPS